MTIEEDLKKGIDCFNEEKLSEAMKIFKNILMVHSSNSVANYHIAIILSKLNRFDESCSFFSFCLREEPKNIKYLQEYIKTLISMGNVNEARTVFKSVRENYEANDQINSLDAQLDPRNSLDFFYRYLENLGIFESKKGELIQVDSKPRPLLTNTFLHWFETQSWSNFDLLELGSGGSTLYFSNFFRSITSYETNSEWYSQLMEKVPSSVKLKKTESIANSLIDERINQFDAILIDCAENRANLSQILVNKNYKGIIFHDNAEWYRNSINLLISAGYVEIPFFWHQACR